MESIREYSSVYVYLVAIHNANKKHFDATLEASTGNDGAVSSPAYFLFDAQTLGILWYIFS